jgi:outer membrane protein OmpA-like peptidoglycan-associated protein
MTRLFKPNGLLAVLSTIWVLTACTTPPAPPQVVPAPAPAVYSGPKLPIAQSDRGVLIFLPSAALFEVGKSTLNPAESDAYLQRMAELLNTKTRHDVLLEGHTDNTGPASINQPLSEARARAVREALVERGVATERLRTAGYSFNRPVASNATEDGRRLNRRVEVVILEEKVETITQGEPANAFEAAWDRLKSLIEQGLVKPVGGT